MQFQANADQYLATEVFTAPPQKLQLMLIDAAIRLIARAQRHWQAKKTGQACQMLLHAQQIVDQLIAGVNRDANPELADRVLAVYHFLATRLNEANTERDVKKLQEVARILEIERETWRLVCDKLSGKDASESTADNSQSSNNSAPAPVFDFLGELPVTGFSLEA